MPCLVSLGHRESVHDELIDKIKEELVGATTIIRAGVVDGGGDGVGDAVDMNIVVDVARQAVEGLADKRRDDDGGGGVGGYTPQSGGGGQTTDIPYRLGRYSSFGAGSSKVYSCACECSTCRLKMEGLINKVEELLQAQKDMNSAIKSMMSKRGVQPSKKLSSPYTPIGIRKRAKTISKALADCRARKTSTPQKSIATPPAEVVPQVLKKVDIFKRVNPPKKKKLETLIKSKKSGRALYSMHEFGAEDFKVMTNMHEWWEDWYVDEILLLMRMRQLNFPEHYDSSDRIMDLNFYHHCRNRYLGLSDESTNVGVVPYDQRLALFMWDDDGLAFPRGSVPYPGGCEWIGAKRIITVMNINDNHFVTVEIIIEEGIINVYDCNIPCNDDSDFFCHMQPLMDLFPKLLKQSGMFSHLPEKLLNESWNFVRKKDIPRNDTNKVCASWSFAFVEALLTRMNMSKPDTLLSDNTVERMQWRWACGIIDKVLEP
ncbi:uncharacterized protein LOC132611056 [Lycium barbarum]|uniref:uncharacterized protein LOC132611056 n=1 Tax=Lycium barbarum TaxID=112863 RepID=UPI00293F6D52|nr:uncharacterized protein LOC132611056 [Lycium barbarum]XP_060181449.1 uncharacterized protein LOC132611056 [Lycium barbarum]